MTSPLGKALRDTLNRIEKESIRLPSPEPEREPTPEVRYQNMRRQWYWHPSSWYLRDWTTGYDGQGCNQGECVPECPYVRTTGRYAVIDGKEIFSYD
jgi:hypothetical protein